MHSKPATFESVSILLDHHGQQPHETFAVSGESKTTNISGEDNLFRPKNRTECFFVILFY